MILTVFVLVLLTVNVTANSVGKKSEELEEKIAACEDITIPMCQDIGYNQTRMPNQFNHATQEEAGLEVHQFWPLVKIECSEDIRFFLCSMYTPICMDSYTQPLPACRSVCERAKRGCLPVMQKYGFDWPTRMSCNLLPEYGGKELCMDAQAQDPKPRHEESFIKHREHIWQVPKLGQEVDISGLLPADKLPSALLPADTGVARIPTGLLPSSPASQCTCQDCKNGMQSSPVISLKPSDFLYNTSVSWAGQNNCAAPCYSPYFTASDRQFTELWLTVWSLVCCVSTSLTFATFLLDPLRNNYPERSIMYLSLCYFMISAGFLIRISIGHQELSCSLQSPSKSFSPTNLYHSKQNLPGYNSSDNDMMCTVVFIFVYMFTMASSLWWLILTLTWFLTTVLKWAEESLISLAPWFHLVSWGLPTLKTGIILALSGVQGDSVAGICDVGTRDSTMLLVFVISPLVFYHFLGICFLATGFISLLKFRRMIKEQTMNTQKLDKLMIKITIFSLLYFVPVLSVVGCYLYQYTNQIKWQKSYLCRSCKVSSEIEYPDFSIYMLKYFMQLAVGITSGFWIWSGKTMDAWSSLLKPLCCFKSFKKSTGGSGQSTLSPAPPPLPLPRLLGAPVPPEENHYASIPNHYI